MLRWSVQTHRINVYFPLYTSFQNNQLISGITQKWHWGLCDFPSQNHNELFGQNKLMCLCSNPLWLFLLPFYFSFFLKKDFIYLFLERGEGKEKERERNIRVGLLLTCQLGTWPVTQACSLIGNWTCDPLVRRPELNPLSYTSHAPFYFSQGIFKYKYIACFWIMSHVQKCFHIKLVDF